MKKEWLWAIISLVIAIVLSYILLSLAQDEAQSKVPFDCVDPTERERVRDLALEGIDNGLKQAMTHLFEVWQKDPNTEQPRRAQVGTTNAINAHNRARKLALAWDPPTCAKEQ
jgi:hypothetical protein